MNKINKVDLLLKYRFKRSKRKNKRQKCNFFSVALIKLQVNTSQIRMNFQNMEVGKYGKLLRCHTRQFIATTNKHNTDTLCYDDNDIYPVFSVALYAGGI